MKSFTKLMLPLAMIVLMSLEMPKGWYAAGSMPEKYEMGTDPGSGRDGKNAATIRSVKKGIKGFGSMMQSFDPGKYEGKRVRMSGYVKSKEVKDKAGLWLRVDQRKSTTPLAFDNMSNRPVKGSSDWQKYEIVLDVPEGASQIALGALLYGEGQIWFDDISLEIVDKSVPLTAANNNSSKKSQPVNLNFDE